MQPYVERLLESKNHNPTRLHTYSGLRWSWFDAASKSQFVQIKQSLDLIFAAYPSLSEIGYSAWKDIVVKYFIPLAEAQQQS